jgi:glycosyltransferase involved in cell wall biosynthesis
VLLLIGGKGKEHENLQSLIKTSGMEENVRLLGFIPDKDLPLAYAAADSSVVPTLALEGFGLIIVESLASGTPALGTPVGGIPEILKGLDENLVFPEPTAVAIADRIQSILDGKITLPDRAACRAHARRYDWTAVGPQLLKIFHQAIEEERG